jgi:hypothetical protein
MWQGHSGPDRDRELEHRQSTVGVGGLKQELYSYLANLNQFAFHTTLPSLEWWPDEFDSKLRSDGLECLIGFG